MLFSMLYLNDTNKEFITINKKNKKKQSIEKQESMWIKKSQDKKSK